MLILPPDNDANHNERLVQEVEALRKQLEDSALALRKERVLWVLTYLILLDFLAFPSLQNWASALVIGVLEVMLILFLTPLGCLTQIIACYKDINAPSKKRKE